MPHSLWDTLDRFEQPPLSMISVDQVEASQTFQEWLCARPETTIVAVLSSIEDSESLLVHFTRNNTFWASRFFLLVLFTITEAVVSWGLNQEHQLTIKNQEFFSMCFFLQLSIDQTQVTNGSFKSCLTRFGIEPYAFARAPRQGLRCKFFLLGMITPRAEILVYALFVNIPLTSFPM